jgi:hypothetical protein
MLKLRFDRLSLQLSKFRRNIRHSYLIMGGQFLALDNREVVTFLGRECKRADTLQDFSVWLHF